jgi:hypothetical protein
MSEKEQSMALDMDQEYPAAEWQMLKVAIPVPRAVFDGWTQEQRDLVTQRVVEGAVGGLDVASKDVPMGGGW